MQEAIEKIAQGAGAKTDASGAALPVWHDYVAGTDPTDATSRFTAFVALEDGKPVVSWSPALNGEGVREGVRTYRVWGKTSLTDAAWNEVAPRRRERLPLLPRHRRDAVRSCLPAMARHGL